MRLSSRWRHWSRNKKRERVSLTDVTPHVPDRGQQSTVFSKLKENNFWNYWYFLWSWSNLWHLLSAKETPKMINIFKYCFSLSVPKKTFSLIKTIMALLLAALMSPLMGRLLKLETNLLIKACFCSSRQSPDRHTLNVWAVFLKLSSRLLTVSWRLVCVKGLD